MIWALISVIAVFLLIAIVILYFFRMAFVRKTENAFIDQLSGEFGGEIKAGLEWYEKQEKGDIFIQSHDGLRLHGVIIKQELEAKGTIILFHGYRSVAKKDFSCALPYYYSLGLNIILIDQRAHGKSEGKIISYGVKERYDACAWVRCARELFPNTKIFLSGISMGSSTVMMASDIVEGVSGIVADCGFTSPKEIIQRVAKKHFNLPKWFCAPVGFLAKAFCGFDYSYNSKESLSRTTVPVLFIHGLADDFVPCYMTEENFEACASKKEKVIVEKATHGISFLVEPERLKKALEDFILSNEE